MNWDGVIARNRDLLDRIIATLFAMAGLDREAKPATLPRCTHNYILRILRPAESALRRLIVIAARNVELDARSSHSVILGLDPRTHSGAAAKSRISTDPGTVRPVTSTIPAFPLLDPLKTFNFDPPSPHPTSVPRITFLGLSDPAPIAETRLPLPGDPVSASALFRRLRATRRALDNLDVQARRFARWRARLAVSKPGPRRIVALRPGYPPGRRKRPIHEIDEILTDLHALAHYAMEPDTS